MIEYDEFLHRESLSAVEWKALLEVEYKAPLEPVILAELKASDLVLGYLIQRGLVEACYSTLNSFAQGHDVAYKLTTLGTKIYQRGPDPNRK